VFGANNTFAFQWSPVKYALSYVLGVSAFRLRPLLPHGLWTGNVVIASTIVILALWASVPGLRSSPLADEFVLVSFLTFAWLLFGSNEGILARTLLLNRPALFIGTLSYGIYLCHFPVLDCLTLATPGLIENPTIKLNS
jgi:peptidoglycan/LPS O-acetylase OafA/YrhL